MRNNLLLIALIVSANWSIGMTEIDSIQRRLNVVENDLENQKRQLELDKKELKLDADVHKAELDKQFTSLSNELQDQYNLMKWLVILGLPLTVVGLASAIWQTKRSVKKKINEKFDRIITQEEINILDVIEKHDTEKQILKNKTILVLSAKGGDDSFAQSFFKRMGFRVDNVNFKKVDTYEDHGTYDLIFANNMDDTFDAELISQYFNSSSSNSVLFYFGRSRYENSIVSDRMSFANAPTQVYGNLINLLKFQDVIRD